MSFNKRGPTGRPPQALYDAAAGARGAGTSIIGGATGATGAAGSGNPSAVSSLVGSAGNTGVAMGNELARKARLAGKGQMLGGA